MRVLSARSCRERAIRFGPGVLIIVAASLSACATPDAARIPEPAQPLPSTQVYFYPTRGQSADQQERDRYECYMWARKQTGFEPSQPRLAPHQRLEVVPGPPPGHETAAGAVTGAILGAVVSPPGREAGGAAIGAVAGAMVGAASEAARREAAQQQYDKRDTQRLEQQAANYRRAMTACLEGRGYTVR